MSTQMKTLLLGTQSDEHLLVLARLGSEQAFESLASRYRRPLRRRCRQLCLSDARAEIVLQRTLCEAWSEIRDGAEFEDLRAWMHQIAARHAAEAMSQRGSRSAGEQHALDEVLMPPDADGAGLQHAPRPDEVLALRGALAAMSPRDADRTTIVKTTNGNKRHVPGDAASEVVGAAFRGLIGRTRRGISALTPAPLLSWAIGRAGQGPSTVAERIGEVSASGGTAGLTGLAIKGGIAAIGAGVAITGSVMIAKPSSSPVGSRHSHHHATGRLVAARPSPGDDQTIIHSPSTAQLHRDHGPRSWHNSASPSKSRLNAGRQRAGSTKQAPGTAPAAHTSPVSTHTDVQRDVGSGHQNLAGAGAGTQTSAAPSQAGATPSTPSTSSSTSPSSGQAGDSHGEGQGAEGQGGSSQGGNSHGEGQGAEGQGGHSQGGNGQGGNGQGGESGGATSGQSAPIGVHIAVEPGSSGNGGGSPADGSAGDSESHGPGVGVSISLGPVGEVGVHVSLP